MMKVEEAQSQYANMDVSSPEIVGDRKKDYICACGKRYFSNPALYVHVKRKHNGKVTTL